MDTQHSESSDDPGSTGEGVGEKRSHGRERKARHLKSVVYTSNSFMPIRDGQQNVVQAKCCIIGAAGKPWGMTVEVVQISPRNLWNHLEKHHKTEFTVLKMAQVSVTSCLKDST